MLLVEEWLGSRDNWRGFERLNWSVGQGSQPQINGRERNICTFSDTSGW